MYRIINIIDGRVYIGQTVNPGRRWSDHKWLAKQKHEQYIHRAMSKYGVENFEYEVIATCLTSEDANETEKLLIRQYNSRDKEFGYNVAPGGETPWNLGLPKELNPLTGIPRSEETKKKISEGNIGKTMPPCSDERKKKMSDMYKGRKLDEDWKNKIGQSNSGKFRSDETKEKISKSNTGKIVSDETKEKMSESHIGMKKSEDTKIKMSENSGKLNRNLVELIIYDYYSGEYTQVQLAEKYNITKYNINCIVNGKTWKHIKRPDFDKSNKSKLSYKLTREKVNEIREKYSNGISKEELSKEYNVSIKNVYYIITYKIWK